MFLSLEGNHRKLTGRSQANTGECVAGRLILILLYFMYYVYTSNVWKV